MYIVYCFIGHIKSKDINKLLLKIQTLFLQLHFTTVKPCCGISLLHAIIIAVLLKRLVIT